VNVAKHGDVCPNEQLVWVLWKILKGDGNDVSIETSCVYSSKLTDSGTLDWTILSQYPGTVTVATQA
jgi:hypothetical protein